MSHVIKFSLVCCAVFWFLVSHSSSQDVTRINLRDFTGRWEGTMIMAQRGDCSTGSGRSAAYPYHLILNSSEDGALVAEPLFIGGRKNGRSDSASTWKGQIQPDLTVTATVPIKGICGTEARKTDATLTGRFVLKKGKYQLELEGIATVCTEMKCTFLHKFELKKK